MSGPSTERLCELFDLDYEAGVLRWKVRTAWHIEVGDVAGSLQRRGYLYVGVDGRRLPAHRIVFAMVNGYWPQQVDHINGVKTDNRPANLRAATQAENGRNSRLRINNTSGRKGVYWNKATGKWQAQCMVNRRQHYIGRFTDIDEATAAVRAFRERMHGEFTRHE